jgi:DNA-directed RNA polymerase subunit alpha
MLDMPIEELDLPMRAYNSLKRNNIVKVGQLLQLKDDDLSGCATSARSRSTR